MKRFTLLFIAALLVSPISVASDDLPRGTVTVARDVHIASTSNVSDTLATPTANTFYLVVGSVNLNNGVGSSVQVAVTYTNALGNAVTLTLVNMGGTGTNTFSGFIYDKGTNAVGLTTTFSQGGSANYDLDVVLVKQ